MRAASFAISSFSRKGLAPLAALGLCVLSGCQHSEPAAPAPRAEATPMEMTWNEEPLGGVAAKPAAPVAVTEGKAPLLYLSDYRALIRVVDLTDDNFLAEVEVRPRTIVRVDERNGVVADSEVLFAGPLPKGHRYGIYIVPDSESVTRTGRFQPRPVRDATEAETAETVEEEAK